MTRMYISQFQNNMIDTSNWQLFSLNKLFNIEKGKRLTKQSMIPGEINYIGATAFNNGVTAKIGNTEHLHPAGTLTVCYNGSVGQTFYQTEPFWATDDVNVLYPKFEMNEYIALFLIPIIFKLGQKYGYVDKWTADKMKETKIPLPSSANAEPDFAYMEQYMKSVEESVKSSVSILNTLIGGGTGQGKINSLQWHSFKIGDLFPEIVKPEVYHSHEVVEYEDGIPYIVRSKYNNGMKYRVRKLDSMKVSPSGVISFGAENASFFFQPEEWCSGRDIYYVNTSQYSEQVCKFLAVCFNKVTSKYNYSFGLFPDLLKEESIKLPVDECGSPDWAYMEQYIAAVEIKSKLLTQTMSKIA